MATYKQLFMQYLDANDIKYTDLKEFVVKIVYNGDNLQTIPVYVFFDEDGDPIVQLKCWNIANFKGKEGVGIAACNKANKEYRWITYCIDDDADVVASIDAYISADTCGDECLRLVRRMVNITDTVYPIFMKAMWGGND